MRHITPHTGTIRRTHTLLEAFPGHRDVETTVYQRFHALYIRYINKISVDFPI